MLRMVLCAAAGGAIGAAGRYLVGVGVIRFIGYGFPWATVIVNVVGSFLMGVLIETMAIRFSASNEMRTFLITGILGGFTTFSAFSLDFALLYERKEYISSLLYLLGSVSLSIFALFAGLSLMRQTLQ